MRLQFGRLMRAEGRQPRRLMGLPFNWPARFVADSPYSQGGRDRFAILAVSAIRSDDRFQIVNPPASPPSERAPGDHPDGDHMRVSRSSFSAARPRRRSSSLRLPVN